MTPLEPTALGELVTQAIEAKVVSNEDTVIEILQKILVLGTKRDALGFVLLCLYTIAASLPHGMPAAMGPVQVYPDGSVSLTQAPTPGSTLFAEVLYDYLGGQPASARDRWLEASDEAAAGSVGAAIWAAAALVKQRRAALN